MLRKWKSWFYNFQLMKTRKPRMYAWGQMLGLLPPVFHFGKGSFEVTGFVLNQQFDILSRIFPSIQLSLDTGRSWWKCQGDWGSLALYASALLPQNEISRLLPPWTDTVEAWRNTSFPPTHDSRMVMLWKWGSANKAFGCGQRRLRFACKILARS